MSTARISAFQGCEYIGNATQRTGKDYYGFIAQEDTVVAELLGGAGTSVATNYVTEIGLTGITLKQGALIVIPFGQTIKTLTLTSGSIIAYK